MSVPGVRVALATVTGALYKDAVFELLQIQAFGQTTDVAKCVDIRNPRGV